LDHIALKYDYYYYYYYYLGVLNSKSIFEQKKSQSKAKGVSH
jgi:hypothetical protein